jgi:hypothetical protein
MGDSGSGKSTSMRNLNPETTFVINVVGKDFPFKSKGYSSVEAGKPPEEGNILETDNFSTIIKVIEFVSSNRPEIKTIVIDDVQYIYANEFMRRINEKSFDKFNDIGFKIWALAMKSTEVRDDLIVFYLQHTESSVTITGDKYLKAKTIGKLVDDKVTLEGLFGTVLMATTKISKDKGVEFGFITHSDGTSTVKSPIGMFEEDFIPNDLDVVRTKYVEYYSD